MKVFGWVLGRVLIGIAALICLLWAFGPYEPASLDATFDPAGLGTDLDAYLAQREAEVPNLKPEVAKQIVWAKQAGERTPVCVVYLHGFSASSKEIAPVPQQVAAALGANLYLARLTGHGRDSAAMAEASVADWMTDTAESLAIARALGDAVIVISTSTGGTLAAAAAVNAELSQGVKGMVFVSPNFEVRNRLSFLLTWPAVRYWARFLTGPEIGFEPRNAEQAMYWTTRYPVEATIPMAALVQAVQKLDFNTALVPALFFVSDEDQVVDPARTRAIAAQWGGAVQAGGTARIDTRRMGDGDDPYSHVLAGEILSPGQTGPTVDAILDWIGALE